MEVKQTYYHDNRMEIRRDFIRIDEAAHKYFDMAGDEYTSMSKVLSSVKIPFDKQAISNRMSGGDIHKKEALLKEWDTSRDDSINHGVTIHKGLEDYFNGRSITDPAISDLAKRFSVEMSEFYRIFTELILYSIQHKIAGTTDLLGVRQSRGSVIDFYDYKTNLSRGIYFDSISRKDKLKHVNKYLLPPLNHLEDCNYNTYALQLSGYAYMSELCFGAKPGKLFLVFIYWDKVSGRYDYRMIPVPYMRMEIIALFDSFVNLKKL